MDKSVLIYIKHKLETHVCNIRQWLVDSSPWLLSSSTYIYLHMAWFFFFCFATQQTPPLSYYYAIVDVQPNNLLYTSWRHRAALVHDRLCSPASLTLSVCCSVADQSVLAQSSPPNTEANSSTELKGITDFMMILCGFITSDLLCVTHVISSTVNIKQALEGFLWGQLRSELFINTEILWHYPEFHMHSLPERG